METPQQTEVREFFVRLGLLEGVRIIREVKSAFVLYFWYLARITVEYEFHGIRIGGVLGLTPHTDERIADDLRGYGTRCSIEQIRRWRTNLTKGGYIATLRTPVGHQVLVIGSAKFLHREFGQLPRWALKVLNRWKSTVEPGPTAEL
jgi:hypothetical protein